MSTRTSTLVPYPTLFRSRGAPRGPERRGPRRGPWHRALRDMQRLHGRLQMHRQLLLWISIAARAQRPMGWFRTIYGDRAAHEIISRFGQPLDRRRSEEHTSELQSLMRISYAVFCLKKKKITQKHIHINI